jgi:hypothetical protein
MARLPVSVRDASLALLLLLPATAAAEVNFVWSAVGREFEMNHAAYDANASGSSYQLDFGPGRWTLRPEIAFTSVSANIFSNDGQYEYAAGIAWRMREDDVGFRLSGGVARLKTFDGPLEAEVDGAYLQAAVIWHPGERFHLGMSWRGYAGEDAEVAGRELGVDYRQFGVFLGWRFGD